MSALCASVVSSFRSLHTCVVHSMICRPSTSGGGNFYAWFLCLSLVPPHTENDEKLKDVPLHY